MTSFGVVYALDLGVRSGYAYGRPGEKPRAGWVTLKASGEHRAVAFSNFIATLDKQFTEIKPQLVVKERWWGLGASANVDPSKQGQRRHGNSEAVVYIHVGLHAIVEGMCGRHGIPWREAGASTIRKHFIGRGRAAKGEDIKEAVKARCRLLGLMAKDIDDDNMADAIATHDWACATFGRRAFSTRELHFFGEEAAYD